ncbi:putative serine protease EDA2 [Pleurostoma richardsiae]|uniref:Serine protease EDA2 n=1 Tax=Pleurostoma richardsiae TaxID=41990 RepID=A0AA38R5J7_9PEZI|nr:putative serine protease EDA2 [Pleurostoma richardsiae]
MRTVAVIAGALFAHSASGFLSDIPRLVPPPVKDDESSFGKRSTGQGTFDQLIDHSNPSLGTFKQQYWWSDEFYAGPGSPVVFFTPGEVAAAGYTGYLKNTTITGMMAQAIGGATILLEHRYWGDSVPVPDLSPSNLQYLNLDNNIADVVYFAQNVKLPFDSNGTSSPSKAPWVMSGGSYSGALAAWTENKAPGTFWAYHASSAAQNAIGDFWQYFYPIQQGMPKNCSTDVAKVMEYVDNILKSGTTEQKQALKDKFGLGGVVHDSDFGNALQNAPWQWQSHDFTTGYSGFFQWCDYVENAYEPAFPNATIPGEEGVGLCKALNGYAKWSTDVLVPNNVCGEGSDCYNSYYSNSSEYTDWSASNGNRAWTWMLCNQPLEFWQDGAPDGTPTLVSRYVNASYWQRQCPLYFPPDSGYTYGSGKGITPEDVNAEYGGWNIDNTTRLIYVNGEFDPWRDSTVSSQFRPGGPLQSTEQLPVKLIPGGIHCSDLTQRNALANAGVAEIQAEVVETITGWVDEFYAEKKIKRQIVR